MERAVEEFLTPAATPNTKNIFQLPPPEAAAASAPYHRYNEQEDDGTDCGVGDRWNDPGSQRDMQLRK